MTKIPLYRGIARKLAYLKASESWTEDEAIDRMEYVGAANGWLSENVNNCLPSGSGIDCGTHLGNESTEKRLVFHFSFHHMHEDGFYDGWTEHKAIVTPSLVDDFNLRITGSNRNEIKDYLYDVFEQALRQEVEPY